jgi:DNA-binding CsgD family transcriptional regulator/PAS domain-containing protein
MARRSTATVAGLAGELVSQGPVGESSYLLNALFKSSTVGVAICDRQLRFCAINGALASMNGIPAAFHLGKTIHAVLGSAAAKIQPAFEHVFATGQPLANFELTAELPAREAVGHWNESYFPIKDDTGHVHQVGVIVLELTKRNELNAALLRLTNKLARISSRLRSDSGALELSHETSTESSDVLSRSVGLVESCLSDVRDISQLLHGAPALAAVQPPRVSRGAQPEWEHHQGFAVAHPIEEEVEYPGLLSSRERQVVALLAIGQTNKQVGNKLVISTRTVESHRAKIMLKLDIHSVSELVRYAVRTHLIRP